ncbi:hypothetical protein [Saccharothrix sp. NRRL B-16348]|uniref:hypothetical protein n=1 Tax=Saccharothrix sp. NRRL B-16348 TaxID=1415542 RepID=UPI0006B05EC7|nr:hypothetical protein [Saccharothrix sp. NRRL B-16348]
MTYDIDLAEMESHATRLRDVAKRVGIAADAGQATSHPEAFGLLGTPLAAICGAAQHSAMTTLREAVDAAADHVTRFDGWREHVRDHDETQSEIFDGMHNG